MGTGSVESPSLKCLAGLPTRCLSPFSDGPLARTVTKVRREKRGQAPRGNGFREKSTRFKLGASLHLSLPVR